MHEKISPCLGLLKNRVHYGNRRKGIISFYEILPGTTILAQSGPGININDIKSTSCWWLLKIGCVMKSLFSHHHHHRHVVLLARISLTLSRYFSLSFISSGGSSGLHPVSSHSCCMYVRAGRPAFARSYEGSVGVRHLWARSCFSSGVLHVWFV